jgi:hypothetical protein
VRNEAQALVDEAVSQFAQTAGDDSHFFFVMLLSAQKRLEAHIEQAKDDAMRMESR